MGSEIVVIGSINMDMVININQKPLGGETVLADGFFMTPGGKGANQAYAAGNLGASISMIGAVGNDVFGTELINNLQKARVNTNNIIKVNGVSTGIAVITVDSTGENSIMVSPAANNFVTPEYIEEHENIIKQAKAVLIQLEIPIESVEKSISIAKKYGVLTLLDPAPAQKLSNEILLNLDYILPNETEIEQLTNVKVFDKESAIKASLVLLNKGVKTVISKLGKDGVVICQKDNAKWIPGIEVDVIDTTGAGDAFAGAFVTCLVQGNDLIECTEYANAVGALTVTKQGAQSAVPQTEEVINLLNKYKRERS